MVSIKSGRTKKGQKPRGECVGGLFPDKPKKPKKNAQVNFRPSDDQDAFLERALGRGYTRTRVVITALDIAIGLDLAINESEMDEFAAYAKASGSSLGSVIGRAARIGFEELKRLEAAEKERSR